MLSKNFICFLTTTLVAYVSSPLFASNTKMIGNPSDANFPMDEEGRVYHLGLKKGEVANQILLVGDPHRAQLLSTLLDDPKKTFFYSSNRGFTTYTGTKKGKPVTIMSIGMGIPMMDFAVREIRAITDGPLSIIRLGSCGTPNQEIPVGSIVVAKESFCVTTNYEGYYRNSLKYSTFDYFHFSPPIFPDTALHNTLVNFLTNNSEKSFCVLETSDATTDSFYGSQGRIDPRFDDRNEKLIDSIMEEHPQTGSLQMETFHLFHLAHLHNRINSPKESIKVAACAIVLAQRRSNEFLSNDRKYLIELTAGNACLEALLE